MTSQLIQAFTEEGVLYLSGARLRVFDTPGGDDRVSSIVENLSPVPIRTVSMLLHSQRPLCRRPDRFFRAAVCLAAMLLAEGLAVGQTVTTSFQVINNCPGRSDLVFRRHPPRLRCVAVFHQRGLGGQLLQQWDTEHGH